MNNEQRVTPRTPRLGLAIVSMVLSSLFAASQLAHAARLLRFEIYQNDQLILEGIGSDSGRETAADVWSRLDAIDWEPYEGFEVPSREDEPLRATLRGPVVIRAKHAQTTVIAEATVAELVLVRDGLESNRWRLPPEEVTRTGIAAGLGEVVEERQVIGLSPGTFGEATLLAGIALIVGLLAVGAVLVATLGRQQRRDVRKNGT